jgi:hypothetical protein
VIFTSNERECVAIKVQRTYGGITVFALFALLSRVMARSSTKISSEMGIESMNMWSSDLINVTRAAISEHRFVPYDDAAHFKNHDSRYGFISVSNILANKLLLIDKKTNRETLYATTDELLEAGWVID